MKSVMVLLCLLVASIAVAQNALDPGDNFNGYVPPNCTGVFLDVPCPSSIYANWVERMYHEGVTVGCGVGIFCPDTAVDREQSIVFAGKTEHRVLARFAAGQASCYVDPVFTCAAQVNNPAIHADTVSIQCTYLGSADVSVPCKVKEIWEGGFELVMQNGRTVMWQSFTDTGE